MDNRVLIRRIFRTYVTQFSMSFPVRFRMFADRSNVGRTFLKSFLFQDFDDINLLDAQVPTVAGPAHGFCGGVPPPPPPPGPGGVPPPPPGPPPAPPFLGAPPPPPALNQLSPNKTRRTLRLHWREARFDFSTLSGRRVDTIWSKLSRDVGPINVDVAQLEHLFENRSSDIKPKVRPPPVS